MTDSADSARIDALEMRVAHQDRALAELNEMIVAQWRTIETLERDARLLREALLELGPFPNRHEPPPPHY